MLLIAKSSCSSSISIRDIYTIATLYPQLIPTRSVSWQDLLVSILFSGTFANHYSNNNNNYYYYYYYYYKNNNNNKNKNKKTCVVALLYVDSHFVDNILLLHGSPQSQLNWVRWPHGTENHGRVLLRQSPRKGGYVATNMANMGVPSGELTCCHGKIHHFLWVNPLFLWPFSIAIC